MNNKSILIQECNNILKDIKTSKNKANYQYYDILMFIKKDITQLNDNAINNINVFNIYLENINIIKSELKL